MSQHEPDRSGFETSNFLYKYGFFDGLMLDTWLDHKGFDGHWAWDDRFTVRDCIADGLSGCRGHSFQEAVLITVVQTHVVPAVDQQLEFMDGPNHNPMRVWRVDGREVDEVRVHEGEPREPRFVDTGERVVLTPAFVDVSDEQILEIARTFAETRPEPLR